MTMQPPSRREREILYAIFALGDRASAEDIRQKLSNPPTDSAVRAMLAKLEAKGHIRHRAEGLRYVYYPTTTRTAARRAALHEVVTVFFGGSPGQAAMTLLQSEDWSDQELEAVSHAVERIRHARRPL